MRLQTRPTLVLGFGVIILLAAILMVVWVSVTHSTIERFDNVVNNSNLKRQLLMDMRTLARERTVSIQKMLIMDDPFERDEEYLRFNRHGTDFVLARQAYLALDLSPEERDLLDSQDAVIGQIGPQQAEIVNLISQEREDEARRKLLDEVIPIQDEGFRTLSIVLKYQTDAAEEALNSAHANYRTSLGVAISLVVSIILLSILVATFITRRTTAAESAMRQEKERAEVTLYSIGDGVITTDDRGRIEQINASAQVITGHTEEAARGRFVNDIIPLLREADHQPVPSPVVLAMDKHRTLTSEADMIFVRKDGTEFAIEYTASPIYSGRAQASGAVLVFRDVTEGRALSHQLAYQARHDNLTGLYNRTEFEKQLELLLSEVRRYPSSRHWLCFADLDQFKVVNDTAGHLAGDELLKQVAGILRHYLRDTDMVARTGGDEFAFILRHCDEESALTVLDRIRRDLHEYRFLWEDKAFTIGASFGLVPITADSGTLYDLLSAADTACYSAKDQGRNRIHVYNPKDDEISRREVEMHWVHEITEALQDNRFTLYYQPIVPLDDHREDVLHFEILVRMLDRGGAPAPPMAFIPAAERYNLMNLIDCWVVENTLAAFEQFNPNRKWLASINLSAQSLCDNDFSRKLFDLLERSSVDPGRICFEITETSAIANLTRAIEFIHKRIIKLEFPLLFLGTDQWR